MSNEVTCKIFRMKDAKLPDYATKGAAGMDVSITEDFMLEPFTTKLASTGIKVELPEGYELQVRPRSGLSLKGVTIVNSPGTIDSDYRGEIKVILHNLNPHATMVFTKGDRIAQLVLAPVTKCIWEENQQLLTSERGEEGFGSTGI